MVIVRKKQTKSAEVDVEQAGLISAGLSEDSCSGLFEVCENENSSSEHSLIMQRLNPADRAPQSAFDILHPPFPYKPI